MNEEAVVSVDPKWRAEVYGLLSLAFHQPPDAASAKRAQAGAETARSLGHEELAKEFVEFARRAAAGDPGTVKQDFNDLFMVPGKKYLAPYESVFLDPPIVTESKASPRTYGASTIQVMTFYNSIGLRVARGYTELPDYVGLELACMEYLCTREAEFRKGTKEQPVRNARGMQCVFLRDHLARWVPKLAERIREKAGTEVYRALAGLLVAWVREETAPCPES